MTHTPRRWIIIAAFAIALATFGISAAWQAHAQQPSALQNGMPVLLQQQLPIVSVAPTSTPTEQPDQALAAAIDAYMQSSTEVHTYTLKDERIVGDTARVLVVPPPDVTDPAFVFARKDAHGWTVLGIGTYFPEEFYRSHNIPAELWVR